LPETLRKPCRGKKVTDFPVNTPLLELSRIYRENCNEERRQIFECIYKLKQEQLKMKKEREIEIKKLQDLHFKELFKAGKDIQRLEKDNALKAGMIDYLQDQIAKIKGTSIAFEILQKERVSVQFQEPKSPKFLYLSQCRPLLTTHDSLTIYYIEDLDEEMSELELSQVFEMLSQIHFVKIIEILDQDQLKRIGLIGFRHPIKGNFIS